MLSQVTDPVTVYEVSPRDGLQNETQVLSVADKRALVEALVAAGLRHVEVTSFVSPRWVPQLADAGELIRSLPAAPGVIFSALCPNTTGLERARLAGLKEAAIFLSASESHNQRNTNKSIQRSLEAFEELIPMARDAGMRVRAYISTVWGCPYEGTVDPRRALWIARELLHWGAYQVSLGDTIGVGTPLQTQDICRLFLGEFAADQLALHFHDTRGTALSNVLVGLDLGIRTFDAAVAGLGGCPYAPGAAGNLASEDLVYMLHGMGIETGIDLEALIRAGQVAERLLGRALPGKVHQAGLPRIRLDGAVAGTGMLR
jgi:hydroxymethylglutaryl-CoA lyase